MNKDTYENIRRQLQQLHPSARTRPTLLIMTTATRESLFQEIFSNTITQPTFLGEATIDYILGIRIESHATVELCMDRMMNPGENEILKFISTETIPANCVNHPYIKRAIHEIISNHLLGCNPAFLDNISIKQTTPPGV